MSRYADTDHLVVLRRLLLVFGAARTWLWVAVAPQLNPGLLAVTAIGLTATAALAFVPRWAPWAPRLALPLLVLQLAGTFPLTDNHLYLESIAVGFLALAGASDADDPLIAESLRWLVAIVLIHTGVQKVLHGCYFHGEFLAFMVSRGGRFADALGRLLPPDEIARLASYDPLRTGAGPYRVDAPAFVALSNAVWIAEIVLGALLLAPRSRRLAAIGALVLVFAIQLGAREIGFLILFGNLLLLFLPVRVGRIALRAELLLFAWAIGAALGRLPGGDLIQAGYL